MSEVSTRAAHADDARSIANIHVASWKHAYRGLMPDSFLDALNAEQRLAMWRRILESTSSPMHVWVAESLGMIVGFCSVGPPQGTTERIGDTLEIYTIYLQPDREREGIGSMLLRQAERAMADFGATSAILWVLSSNHRARKFYEASGWTPDGTEKIDDQMGISLVETRYRKRLVAEEH